MTESILEEAARLTSGDRQKVYSHPADDFDKVAEMAGPILRSGIDPRLRHALYMICVKIARLLNTPDHRDSIVDIAGYAQTYAMVLERMAPPEASFLTEKELAYVKDTIKSLEGKV